MSCLLDFSEIDNLVEFIKVICRRVKCGEAADLMRIDGRTIIILTHHLSASIRDGLKRVDVVKDIAVRKLQISHAIKQLARHP